MWISLENWIHLNALRLKRSQVCPSSLTSLTLYSSSNSRNKSSCFLTSNSSLAYMLVLYCKFNKVLSTGASVKIFYEGLGNGQRLAGCILKVCWGKQETVRKIKRLQRCSWHKLGCSQTSCPCHQSGCSHYKRKLGNLETDQQEVAISGMTRTLTPWPVKHR